MIQNATSIRTHTEIYINCEGPKKKKKKSFKNILFIKETIKYIISKSINHRVETVTILPKTDSKYLYYVDFFETQNLNLMKNIYPLTSSR